MKKVENEKGFLVFEITREEMLSKLAKYGCRGLQDTRRTSHTRRETMKPIRDYLVSKVSYGKKVFKGYLREKVGSA